MINEATKRIVRLKLDLKLPLIKERSRGDDQIRLKRRICRAVLHHECDPVRSRK